MSLSEGDLMKFDKKKSIQFSYGIWCPLKLMNNLIINILLIGECITLMNNGTY